MPRTRGWALKGRETFAAVIKAAGDTGAVARGTGISRQTIGALASGRKTSTSKQTAEAIASFVQVPLDQLFTPPAEESATRRERA